MRLLQVDLSKCTASDGDRAKPTCSKGQRCDPVDRCVPPGLQCGSQPARGCQQRTQNTPSNILGLAKHHRDVHVRIKGADGQRGEQPEVHVAKGTPWFITTTKILGKFDFVAVGGRGSHREHVTAVNLSTMATRRQHSSAARVARVLRNKGPKLVENTKRLLGMKGLSCSSEAASVVRDLVRRTSRLGRNACVMGCGPPLPASSCL